MPRRKPSSPKPTTAIATTDKINGDHPVSPVVGIGASAGGLAAYKIFLSQMPADTGMAFVLVPHLDPTHQSLMVELLASQTEMPVCEAKETMAVEANHVYIIPPGKYLEIEKGRLHLSAPPHSSRSETAIDHFLRSLAVDQMERAIGIVLSGTSSHGTLGLQAIKANGGMAMVQQPGTAEYEDMPQNAIDSGIVDYILPPEKMADALIRYVQHAYVSGVWDAKTSSEMELEQLEQILLLMREHTKHDFRSYRKNMVLRRVHRRMGVNHIDHLNDYRDILRKNTEEARALLRDLLISVTSFFRDPDAYAVLEEKVVSQWLEHRDSELPIRIWIPGCATGEEVYSIAMLLVEKFAAAGKLLNLQIYATDIDEVALDFARRGRYPVSIAEDITPERLARFFSINGDHYVINKQVRERVVFAVQNLLSDVPFSKLDLISCRNLLIYLETEVQQKMMTLFHFALNENGCLFLGSSETVGRKHGLFETLSKKWRLFRRIEPTRRDLVEFPITTGTERPDMLSPTRYQTSARTINFAEITQRQLLLQYAPASVLINRKYEVLYFQGATGEFLEPPTGEPTSDLIAMAREGLQTKLRAACYQAVHENLPVVDVGARVKNKGSWQPCTISVKPIIEPRQADGLLLVTFQRREANQVDTSKQPVGATGFEDSVLIRQLEYELKATRDDLQGSIEDMESSNEELKTSNEEIMSMNEELQSANEELETSKEELQSLNEELSTVNSQLQDKVEELDKAQNDMTNLLKSADIATLFLDTSLNILRFTPTTGKLLGLISSDIGRPISKFASEFTGESLLLDAREVLDTLTPLENEFSVANGRHYIRRTFPYRTAKNRISGLVVNIIDITQRVEAEAQLRHMATVLKDSNDAICVLALDGHITAWNRGAEQLYGYTEAEAQKMNLNDIVPAAQQQTMQTMLQRIKRDECIKSFDTVRLTKDGRTLDVWVTLTPLYDENGQPMAVATTERDISDRIQLDALRAQQERLRGMVEHLPAGAVYFDGYRLTMNFGAEEITGYDRDELVTLDAWFKNLYGEQESEFREMYQKEREAGFPRQSGPLLLQRKNGEKRYVEYAAYKFDNHEVWIMHDVTKRQLSAIALRDREERLHAIMDYAAEAFIVINAEGEITDFNNAAKKIFGYSEAETIGQNVNMLMPSPYREEHDGYLAHYHNSGKREISIRSRELPGRRKDGSTFMLELTVSEVDHLGVFVGIIRDLTQQRELEKQIADISTQEQERIGQEIHDGLGQQLTGISMMATSVKRHLASKNLLEAVQMEELVQQLQAAIKEARTLSHGLSPVPVTPEGLKDALTILARGITSNTGISCQFKSDDLVDIKDRTSAMQIYRIIQEAVNNAVKHAHANKITISINGDTEHYGLSVHDDGEGFDSSNTNGEGLGIRIMRYRASIIGCKLEVKSQPGEGTTVSCKKALMNTRE